MSRSSTKSSRQTTESLDRIRAALYDLRLPLVRTRLDEMVAAPEADQTRLEWLWSLLDPQHRRVCEARIERRIRESKMPARKTLADFDFAFQPTIDRDLVLELSSLAFIDQGVNVLLAGMSGVGKSHIALALGLCACTANRRVRYTTSAAMLEHLTNSLATNSLNKTLRVYTTPELLLIDEVGLEQVERSKALSAGLMQKVLFPRYQGQQSTIITSNLEWKNWGQYLDDELGAMAILDRLIYRSRVMVIKGPSYRDHIHQLEVAKAREARSSADPGA